MAGTCCDTDDIWNASLTVSISIHHAIYWSALRHHFDPRHANIWRYSVIGTYIWNASLALLRTQRQCVSKMDKGLYNVQVSIKGECHKNKGFEKCC